MEAVFCKPASCSQGFLMVYLYVTSMLIFRKLHSEGEEGLSEPVGLLSLSKNPQCCQPQTRMTTLASSQSRGWGVKAGGRSHLATRASRRMDGQMDGQVFRRPSFLSQCPCWWWGKCLGSLRRGSEGRASVGSRRRASPPSLASIWGHSRLHEGPMSGTNPCQAQKWLASSARTEVGLRAGSMGWGLRFIRVYPTALQSVPNGQKKSFSSWDKNKILKNQWTIMLRA